MALPANLISTLAINFEQKPASGGQILTAGQFLHFLKS
jgi:hypothetical protein